MMKEKVGMICTLSSEMEGRERVVICLVHPISDIGGGGEGSFTCKKVTMRRGTAP